MVIEEVNVRHSTVLAVLSMLNVLFIEPDAFLCVVSINSILLLFTLGKLSYCLDIIRFTNALGYLKYLCLILPIAYGIVIWCFYSSFSDVEYYPLTVTSNAAYTVLSMTILWAATNIASSYYSF